MRNTVNIYIRTIETTTADIKLTKDYTVDGFVSKVENSCRAVLCELSIIKQKHPELEQDFEYFGIELHELLNIIENGQL